MFKTKKQVNKTERLSYFLVQLALRSAYVSPLPPPPTFSSVFRLSEINKKNSKCQKKGLALKPTTATTQTISTCAHNMHLDFHLCSIICFYFKIQGI